MSLPQTLLALAAIVALILIGLIVRRITRTAPVRAARPQTPSLRSQPHLETPDGHTVVPLPNLDAGGCVIGRAPDADVQLDAILPCADSIAARHARIYRDAASGFVIIETLDTTRGIWINGVRATRKNLLKDRWVIGLGECTLIYRDGNPDTGPLR
ncbi:MAG: FHA domain-containing protein [Anaerolineae bacterium]|nr:FHA domain-containing protein [Anaerolineae bacterium]MDW8070608.1 FHA domain-containing protein [Anaerolineae bacterium]